MFHKQARQESNLQPPVLERTPSNAGVEAFVDFQRLRSRPTTPASLDNAGVDTVPGTAEDKAPKPIGGPLRKPPPRHRVGSPGAKQPWTHRDGHRARAWNGGLGLAAGRAPTSAETRDPVHRSRSQDASLQGQGPSRMARDPPARHWTGTAIRQLNASSPDQRLGYQ